MIEHGSKRGRETRARLTPDQFEVTGNGELVIKEAEIVQAIQEQPHAPGSTQADRPDIGVVVSVGVNW